MDMPGGENEPLPSSLTPDELGGIPGIGGKLGIMGWPAWLIAAAGCWK